MGDPSTLTAAPEGPDDDPRSRIRAALLAEGVSPMLATIMADVAATMEELRPLAERYKRIQRGPLGAVLGGRGK